MNFPSNDKEAIEIFKKKIRSIIAYPNADNKIKLMHIWELVKE